MVSAVIVLPDPEGTKVDVRPLKTGGVAMVRERVEFATSAPVVAKASALIDGGQTANLDSPQVSAGRAARLAKILVCGLAPWVADVQVVLNGLATMITTIGSALAIPAPFDPPSPDYITVAQSATAGFDGFRLVLTNESTEAANFHVTFFYDEEEPA